MSLLRRLHPSPALVISCVALALALGGTSYAALRLPKNSVTTYQVKDFSLLARDFKRGQIPAGPAGPAGAEGPAGPQGPAGPAGPSGSAKAYARVLGSGAVDTAHSRGVTVSHPFTGVYCITVTGGASNAVATRDSTSEPGLISAGVVLTRCPSGTSVEVRTFHTSGTAADEPFMVLIN
jgi:hypothetical protein